MIGNSYTQGTQDRFAGFADASSSVDMMLQTVTLGGMTLSWHYANRDNDACGIGRSLTQLLSQQDWDIVTLQDQSLRPTTVVDPDAAKCGDIADSRQGARDLASLVREHLGSPQLAIFETWARHADWPMYTADYGPAQMQQELRQTYRDMADELDAIFIPVGDAWQRVYTDPQANAANLHQEDLGHPSEHGCYLTGAVFYETLFGQSCLDVAYSGGLPDDEAAYLREIAHQTVRNEMRTRS